MLIRKRVRRDKVKRERVIEKGRGKGDWSSWQGIEVEGWRWEGERRGEHKSGHAENSQTKMCDDPVSMISHSAF